MSSLNQVNLIGRVGQDPEVRSLGASGSTVTTISIATSESWKDKNTGEKKELTEWHRVVFYNKLADIAGEYLRKGSLVFVSGSIHTRKWTDKDGQDRYSTEIKGSEMKMLGSKSDGAGGSQREQRSAPPAASQSSGGARRQAAPPVDDDSDLPF